MSLSGTSDLYIAELVLYILLFPITIYLGYRHGWPGFLGYFYLSVTCAVPIASRIVALLPANRDATHPTVATAVLSSIGLSPLILALAGFLHEAHVTIFGLSPGPVRRAKRAKGWLWFAQLQIHTIAVVGIVLLIIGSVKLGTSTVNPLTQSQTKTYQDLRKAGAILLLVLWAGLFQYSLFVTRAAQRLATKNLTIESVTILKQMTTCILLTTPFIGLRCVYTVVYTFDSSDSELSPITGGIWVKVVFFFLSTLGAVVCLCLSGGVSVNMSENCQDLGSVSDTQENVGRLLWQTGRKG